MQQRQHLRAKVAQRQASKVRFFELNGRPTGVQQLVDYLASLTQTGGEQVKKLAPP